MPWQSDLRTSLLLLPLGVVAGAVLVGWRRRRGQPAATAWRRSVAEVAMVAGTLPWIWMILTPTSHPRELHPVPLLDLLGVLRVGPVYAFVQIVGNLLVFAAFGFFARLRWRISTWSITLIAAAASAILETLQYVLDLGRVTATDDVLLNAAGAGLAALLAAPLVRRLQPEPEPAAPIGNP